MSSLEHLPFVHDTELHPTPQIYFDQDRTVRLGCTWSPLANLRHSPQRGFRCWAVSAFCRPLFFPQVNSTEGNTWRLRLRSVRRTEVSEKCENTWSCNRRTVFFSSLHAVWCPLQNLRQNHFWPDLLVRYISILLNHWPVQAIRNRASMTCWLRFCRAQNIVLINHCVVPKGDFEWKTQPKTWTEDENGYQHGKDMICEHFAHDFLAGPTPRDLTQSF